MVNLISLKFCLINAENLFLMFDHPVPAHFEKLEEGQWQKLSTSVYENKPLFKLKHLARTLLEINADIIMLCEVGGLESLKNFNHLFLKDAYTPILVEGNSDRNIDVGYLIRKNQPYYYDLLSHKNRDLNFLYPHEITSKNNNYPLKIQSHKFSRDCAELRLFSRDIEKPFLIILLTHLKSPLDPERIDPNGAERRTAELKACLEIHNELALQFPDCPIIFAGDLNGHASSQNTDPEFKALYQMTALKDIFEIANVNPLNRYTFYQVRSGFRSDGRQIDYCFINEKFKSLLNLQSVCVADFKDEFGSPLRKPETLDQKLSLPSDHYPVVFNLDNIPVK